ncbi:uncharacterized protein LOC110206280 [Phascolarctos cinereus]
MSAERAGGRLRDGARRRRPAQRQRFDGGGRTDAKAAGADQSDPTTELPEERAKEITGSVRMRTRGPPPAPPCSRSREQSPRLCHGACAPPPARTLLSSSPSR